MADNLVIVESPAKARTIKKYLGRDFEVLASYGHVRDLVPKEGAVDPDDGFAMQYQLVERNERHVDAIAKALKKAKALHLATDPDREGEAIAWHLYEILKQRGELKLQAGASRRVSRDHAQCGARSGGLAARPVARPGQRAAGAPRTRLPGRLQSVAAAVEEGTARAVRRPGAEPRAAHDLRARSRDRRVRAARILEHRCRRRALGAIVSAEADRIPRQQGRAVQLHQRGSGARRRADAAVGRRAGSRAHGAAGRSQAAPAQSGAAVHHLDAAAGSLAQARLLGPAHHAPGAAAV